MRHCPVVDADEREQLGDRFVMLARVLAHIEDRHLKSERPTARRTQDTAPWAISSPRARVRIRPSCEVGDEGIGMCVVEALDMPEALLEPSVGVDQAGPYVGALEAIWLGCRAPASRCQTSGGSSRSDINDRFHFVAHRSETVGDRELVGEVFDQPDEMAYAAIVLEQERLQGCLGVTPGFPIPVSSDPRPESDRLRRRRPRVGLSRAPRAR